MSKFSFQTGDQVLRIISVLRDGLPSIIISAYISALLLKKPPTGVNRAHLTLKYKL